MLPLQGFSHGDDGWNKEAKSIEGAIVEKAVVVEED